MPGLEHSGEGRLFVYVEVMAFQQPRCVGAFGYVHDYRSVRLRQVLPAEPRYFRNPTSFSFSSISTTPARSSPYSSSTALQYALSTLTGYHCSHSTRDPTAVVFFGRLLHPCELAFVPAGDANASGATRISCDCQKLPAASLVSGRHRCVSCTRQRWFPRQTMLRRCGMRHHVSVSRDTLMHSSGCNDSPRG
jgi:hypothetical protein